MKKIMKAITITARKVWDEISGPVLGLAFGGFVALLLCGAIVALIKFPLMTIGAVVVILILLFIHQVSVTYRKISMDDSGTK